MEPRLPEYGDRVEVKVVRIDLTDTQVVLAAAERNPPKGRPPQGYGCVYRAESDNGRRAAQASPNDHGVLIFKQRPDGEIDGDNLVGALTRLCGTSGGYWEYYPADAQEASPYYKPNHHSAT